MTEQIVSYETPGFRDEYSVNDGDAFAVETLESAKDEARSKCGILCTLAVEDGLVGCKPREFATAEARNHQELRCMASRLTMRIAVIS